MALGKCVECGKSMATNATNCPHCGSRTRPATGLSFLAKVGIGAGVVVVLIGITNRSPAKPEPQVTGVDSSFARDKAFAQRDSDRTLVRMSEAPIRAMLKDPESARFSDVYVRHNGESAAVCGSVSAKNGFGGYGEPELFVITGSVTMISTSDNYSRFSRVWDVACTDKVKKRKAKKVSS